MLKQSSYEEIRHLVQPGDIIAFGGNSWFSKWTKLTTNSKVTHIAMVLHLDVTKTDVPDPFHKIVEATHYKGDKGVMTNSVTERLRTYNGDIWWLPLHESARSLFNENQQTLIEFMFSQIDKGYDIWQLFGSAVDITDDIPVLKWLSYNKKNPNTWFCSELIAEGLEVAGVVKKVNSAEVTPIDICRFDIFDNYYVQLKGKARPIKGFNSENPTYWGYTDEDRP